MNISVESLAVIIYEEHRKQFGEGVTMEYCETVARAIVEYIKSQALLAILDRIGVKES